MRLFDRGARRVQSTGTGGEIAAVVERMLNGLGIKMQSLREVVQERRGLMVISSVMSMTTSGATGGPLMPGVRVTPRAEPRLVRRIGLIGLRRREPTPAAAAS